MSLPVSNQLRICTSCDAAIDPGCRYGHDPDGNVVCEDCIPSESLEQYEGDELDTDDWSLGLDWDDWDTW